MAKTACNLVVMMGIVVAGSAGTALSAFGAEPDLLAIRIFVVTVAGVRPDMLVRAQTETARIYAAVGVRLVWEADPLSLLPRLSMLIVSDSRCLVRKSCSDCLGCSASWGRRHGSTGLCVPRTEYRHLLGSMGPILRRFLPVSWHTNWVISSWGGGRTHSQES